MLKGPIDYECGECGAETAVYEFIRELRCHACGAMIASGNEWEDKCGQRFPPGVSCRPPVNVRERRLFEGLGPGKEDAIFIHVTDDAVWLSFPIKIPELRVGGKRVALDGEARERLSWHVARFFAEELSASGFKENNLCPIASGSGALLEFFKEAVSDEEAEEALRLAVGFKKRFGF